MKHIYFVRHGQSEYNLSETMLHHDTPLTERGLSQAQVCAKRFSSIDFDLVVSSTYKRAIATAEAIGVKRGCPIIADSRFLEYRYPDTVIGLSKKDGPLHVDLMGGRDMRYPGGESFEDVKRRVLLALRFLEEREEGAIVVVSHAFFIWIALAVILFGEDASFEEFERLFAVMHLSNTGISHATHEPKRAGGKRWRIVTWNDDSHLGEVK